MKKLILIICLSMCLSGLTGCATLLIGAAGGAAGVSYIKGAAEGVYEFDMDTCWTACRGAFDSLEIKLRRGRASWLLFTMEDYLDLTSRHRLLIKHLTKMRKISFKQGHLFRRVGDGIFFATKKQAKCSIRRNDGKPTRSNGQCVGGEL